MPELDLRAAVVAGELVGPADGLAALAAELAERQRSPATRRTYPAVFRSFVGLLEPHAPPAAVTPATVRAYRDALERAGRSPATIATTTVYTAVNPGRLEEAVAERHERGCGLRRLARE